MTSTYNMKSQIRYQTEEETAIKDITGDSRVVQCKCAGPLKTLLA